MRLGPGQDRSLTAKEPHPWPHCPLNAAYGLRVRCEQVQDGGEGALEAIGAAGWMLAGVVAVNLRVLRWNRGCEASGAGARRGAGAGLGGERSFFGIPARAPNGPGQRWPGPFGHPFVWDCFQQPVAGCWNPGYGFRLPKKV